MSKENLNVAQKLIQAHLFEGDLQVGTEIGLKIDQTLTQDATGTMVMLELEAMNLDQVQTEVSVQYVDHNLIRSDYRNSDDAIFLLSACQKFGLWYSRPGNGVSHPVHMQNFGIPGKTLLGSDSHTPGAGALGMIAIGAGGLEVAMAMKGKPYYIDMPQIWGVKLTGTLPPWVSAKDVILELLRRYDVKGGVGKIIEYYGPGVDALTTMDRHVICNMGAELGATSSVFPSDQEVKRFLRSQGREQDWVEIAADENCEYDLYEEIDLSQLEPLIALPSSPGKVVPVSQVAGAPIMQSYIGSSANPGLRDIAIVALIFQWQKVNENVWLDINPASAQILENLLDLGYLKMLLECGARIHEPGCNGCIGMGQAPSTKGISLRTVPRNFPGRSGTENDQVYLCSPETAAASALTGVITDPRTLNMEYPVFIEPDQYILNKSYLVPPLEDRSGIELIKGPNIMSLPAFTPLPEDFEGPVLLKVGDNISTDEIMPAGATVLPYRSNIQEISRFVFNAVDKTFYERALTYQNSGFCVVAGENYGQGSSREHAAIAPRFLGLKIVIAKSFARIHLQNLFNFGIVPLTFANKEDYDKIDQDDVLQICCTLRDALQDNTDIVLMNTTKQEQYVTKVSYTKRHIDSILAGSLLNL